MDDLAKVNQKAIRAALKKLGAEIHTALPDGTPITKEEALANLLWNYALGFIEVSTNDIGKRVEKTVPPAPWALQYVVERLEGKVALSTPEAETRIRATERVRDLARERINGMTAKVAGPPVRT